MVIRKAIVLELALATFVALLSACSTTTRITSDYDHGEVFTRLRTFALVARPHVTTLSPLLIQETYDTIRDALVSKGFRYVASVAEADMALDFTIGTRDRLDISTYPGWGGPGWWGNQLDVRQYREGTLAIDVYDVGTRRPVWHASGIKELSKSDIEDSRRLLRESVMALLADFPP